jgi:hypothetical protein
MSETVGWRLFLIRAACGEGERDPESIAAFVKRVQRITGAKYQESTISLLERMKQKWRLVDVDNFARADPLRRGPVWLAYGDSASDVIDPEHDHRLTPEEEERAMRAAEQTKREREADKRSAKGARGRGK